ncbi:MAG TPA: class I SAM-dependent methyltransferase [Gemmatimonadaceae bacterium]|nr:class I SAM-dependent methyltransferase [Gemmatimonadaceae bacterium]
MSAREGERQGEPRATGDHFSEVSAAYAEFRPHYPPTLFEFLASRPAKRVCAWDCGAGSGQATVDLAAWFDRVIATDVSATQIARAPRHPRIEWRVEPAEQTTIDAGSIDLVTVATALHWFDHPRFYAEVRRVAAPGAAIAAWVYTPARMDGEAGVLLRRFARETVGAYWPPERRHVDEAYANVPFPFERVSAPDLVLSEDWTLDQLAGYARTWSSTARYVARHGVDPVIELSAQLATVWGQHERRRIEWPLVILAGRVA